MDTVQKQVDELHDQITDLFIEIQGIRVLSRDIDGKAKAASMALDIRRRLEGLGLKRSAFINSAEITRRR